MKDNVIEKIIKAISLIDRRDYEIYQTKLISKENIYGWNYKTYENNFVTKFNEKFALIEYIDNSHDPRDLQKHLQITKAYIYSEYNDHKVESAYNRLRSKYGDTVKDGSIEFETIPDFFIHKGQEDKDPDNQELIIEFKTELNIPEYRFMWDFFKLNLYIEKYQFKIACFICINNSISYVEDFIFQYIEDKHYLATDKNKLYILVQENYNAKIKYFTLEQFMIQNGYYYDL